jgi:hypothetical protein
MCGAFSARCSIPEDGSRGEAVDAVPLFAGAGDCTVMGGGEGFALGDPLLEERPPSRLSDADLVALQGLDRVRRSVGRAWELAFWSFCRSG